MPWINEKQYPLETNQVETAPAVSGVLGLLKGEAWVYIASTNNIRQALLYYLDGNMPWISQQQPVRFTFEVVGKDRRTTRCGELTTEYRPVFLNCA